MLLRYLRRTLAVVYGGLVLFYFLDLWRWLPPGVSGVLHLQFIPAFKAGLWGLAIVGAILLLTLLFGRIYCSVLCPLGILQDVILRLKKWWRRLVLKRKTFNARYQKPLNIIRYGVLIAVAFPFVVGSVPLMLLDPYAIFGRISFGLFRPAVVWANDVAAGWLNNAGHFWIYRLGEQTSSTALTVFAAVIFAVIAVMVFARERLWCNTICPVGAFLGLFSRFSFFRITVDKAGCNSCRRCEMECKVRCIDSRNKTVDTSRCVACFDCLGHCKQDAVSFAAAGWKYERKEVKVKEVRVATADAGEPEDLSRRRFLKNTLLVAGAATAGRVLAQGDYTEGGESLPQRTTHALPPGAVSRQRFERTCTACQLCVSKCPTQVLQPAFLENGFSGVMQPYMRFRVESFCNYECEVCFSICPNHALTPLTLDEKKLTRVGEVHFVREKCIVYTKDQHCGACAEHCPTGAVKMVPYKNGLTIPETDAPYCIGCGGCESICPVGPDAIFVEGLDLQEPALPPTKDVMDVETIDSFGF